MKCNSFLFVALLFGLIKIINCAKFVEFNKPLLPKFEPADRRAGFNNILRDIIEGKSHPNFDKDGETSEDYNMGNETESYLELVKERTKREEDPHFRGHPKTREEVWHRNFNLNSTNLLIDQANSLVSLLKTVVTRYMNACIPIVLYDAYVEEAEGFILQRFFEVLPQSFIHGKISDDYIMQNVDLMNPKDSSCRSYILFLSDALKTRLVLGPQTTNKVVVIPRSTQWKLQEFLSSPLSSDIVNLLVVGDSYTAGSNKERPYVLYTHRLYADGLGSNVPVVLTSWIQGKFTRPDVNLFPMKFAAGFSGHRFTVSVAMQPPFIFKRKSVDGVGNLNIRWEGVEIRLLKSLSDRLNFSIDLVEAKNIDLLGPGNAVTEAVRNKKADIGMAGTYVTPERNQGTQMSVDHSIDCASFITLTSKALPRYRAILGPFQWPVWVALTSAYLLAIVPLAYTDRLSLRHLIGNYGEIENMFWYVFGTFTNSLSFTGQFSWSNTKKTSTRLLIGFYWIFTIIITACYTGSIIAFVTLPVFPETVDTIADLLRGYHRIGTLDRGGWEHWFDNSSDPEAAKLLKNLEFVVNVEEGLSNITKAFFWPYAFLGSRVQLEYVVQSNYTDDSFGKRTALHISDNCFAMFGVGFVYPPDVVYSDRMDEAVMRFQQSGLIMKFENEVQWEMQRTGTGKLLQASTGRTLRPTAPDERGLTLADTEGMFLLMGVGYLVAGIILLSEIVGGFTNKIRAVLRRASAASSSFASSKMPSQHNITMSEVSNDDNDMNNKPSHKRTLSLAGLERPKSTEDIDGRLKNADFKRRFSANFPTDLETRNNPLVYVSSDIEHSTFDIHTSPHRRNIPLIIEENLEQ